MNIFQWEKYEMKWLHKYSFTQSIKDIQLIRILMQTAKQGIAYKLNNYDIQLSPMGEKRLSICIVDSITKTQFFQKDLTLQFVGVSTLIKAFEKGKKEISATINHKKGGQIQMVQIKIVVQSAFLRPVQEVLFIKKSRDISEAQALKKSIDYLNRKMKDLKASQEADKSSSTYCQMSFLKQKNNEKHFAAGNTFETFSTITLPKGKYLINWSYLAKATNQLMYCYLNQGQTALLTNCAYYMPSNSYFVPFTLKKVHTVNGQSQTLNLQTYCTASYPVTIRNCTVTAKRID